MTRYTQATVGLAAGALAALVTGMGLVAAPAAPASPGIYTVEQATRGEAIFREHCVSCHREGLAGRKSDGGPMLRGAQFTTKWGNQTIHALFATMEELMPGRHPGSLTRAQYADTVSYILKMNGMAPGPTALPSDPEAQFKVKLRFR